MSPSMVQLTDKYGAYDRCSNNTSDTGYVQTYKIQILGLPTVELVRWAIGFVGGRALGS